jgi:hypothetical protein
VFRGLNIKTGEVVAIKQIEKKLIREDQMPQIMVRWSHSSAHSATHTHSLARSSQTVVVGEVWRACTCGTHSCESLGLCYAWCTT